jgi:hypothetical protein
VALVAAMLVVLRPAGTAVAAESSEANDDKYSFFLERSYIFNTLPYRDLVFEGQIAPHFFVHQSLGSRIDLIFAEEWKPVKAWSWSFTPMVKLRMLNEPSQPVRTPSYMPKLDVQYLCFKRTREGKNRVEQVRSPIRLWAVQATVGHHSNGQEGCLYEEQVKVDDECVFPDGAPEEPTANLLDGSFSTNYLRLGVFHSWISSDRNLEIACTHAVGLSAEINPAKFGPGGIGHEQRIRYGQTRVRGTYEFTQRHTTCPRGRFRFEGFAEYIHDAPEGVPRVTVSASPEFTFDSVGGWGFFLRYYRGQDYYNLGFLSRLHEVAVGIVFDAGKFAQFALPAL